MFFILLILTDLNSVLLEMDRLDVLAHQYKNQTNSEERKKIGRNYMKSAANAKVKHNK